jgi:hypothetical protein
MTRIARVFPRRTKASPRDSLAFFDEPGLFPPSVDEVHVSVTFSWDLPRAEYLARAWKRIAPVKIGGPATGMRGEDFASGIYLANGYVITSRGCPNHCWFCDVWKRDGNVRELPITDGYNILDDNLLACSIDHQAKVFDMLRRYPRRPEFTGGLEAARFNIWHATEMATLHTKQMFFAYDTPDDWEPLEEATRLCWNAGFTKSSHAIRAYVLIGYPSDTLAEAENRLRRTANIGVLPMAMLWRNKDGLVSPDWQKLQRNWARPAIIGAREILT